MIKVAFKNGLQSVESQFDSAQMLNVSPRNQSLIKERNSPAFEVVPTNNNYRISLETDQQEKMSLRSFKKSERSKAPSKYR